MQLANRWLLTVATVLAAGVSRGMAQDSTNFDTVPTSSGCTVSAAVTVPARSDIECAVQNAKNERSRSFSFINGVCVLSNSLNCIAADSGSLFVKRQSHPGYVDLIDGRQFWVFQQRLAGRVAFNRTWVEYENGFGEGVDDNTTEFWTGLQLIRNYTQSSSGRTLRIEMTTLDGVLHAAEWLNFTVSGASTKYTINCGVLINNSGFSCDPIQNHRGMQFSTMDRDNDMYTGDSCSLLYGNGGFWFHSCVNMNPNGWYSLVDHSASYGLSKYGYMCTYCIGGCLPLSATRMMLQL